MCRSFSWERVRDTGVFRNTEPFYLRSAQLSCTRRSVLMDLNSSSLLDLENKEKQVITKNKFYKINFEPNFFLILKINSNII